MPLYARNIIPQANYAVWSNNVSQKFSQNFYVGNYSQTWHIARIITQPDWGFIEFNMRIRRLYYSPDSAGQGTFRFQGYYSGHSLTQIDGPSSATQTVSTRTDFGPGGSFTIHQAANGGYWRDCWGTDLYITLSSYAGYGIDFELFDAGGTLWDNSTALTDVYPASFGGTATQSAANSWNVGRGVWFGLAPSGTFG